MSIHNQQALSHAQILAQQVLVKLSEQNAISFEITLSLSDKVSLLEQDFTASTAKINEAFGKTQEQIKGMHHNINRFFDSVNTKIEELKVEFRRNDGLLVWKETLLDRKVYNELNIAQKILCMVHESNTISKGQ